MAYPQEAFCRTTFSPGSFWAGRREVVRSVTLKHQLKMLKDTGRYDAFKLRWNPVYSDEPTVWPVPNHLFWDSDVAKWIEGACYFLVERSDHEIAEAVNELVEMIRGAQQEDGYINIHFTVVQPDKRFSNLKDLHELYNAGHLIEAAIAHHVYSNDRRLLDPIITYVDLLSKLFGPGPDQLHGYPGHPEIELSLIRLYGLSRKSSHLELAQYFITERGNDKGQNGIHYFDYEAQKREASPHEQPAYYPAPKTYWYHQAKKPILEQEAIEGHAVRAMYLLIAVADLVRLSNGGFDAVSYGVALDRLWNNMVEKKMYLTGGIGAIKQWEGFGIDYFLPQGTDEGGCYAETCAAIGVVMLAERQLQINLDSKFADIMELCLYNSVLTGMSHDGKAFTYVNQLASSTQDPSKRYEWFECACCPPNVTRLLASLGGYISSSSSERQESGAECVTVNIHVLTSMTLDVPYGSGEKASTLKIEQKTKVPDNGIVDFNVSCGSNPGVPEAVDLQLRIRHPSWSTFCHFTPPSEDIRSTTGYYHLPLSYLRANTSFRIELDMTPRLVRPHSLSNQPIVAVAKGPVIYCVEDVDNPWVLEDAGKHDHFKDVVLDEKTKLREVWSDDIGQGYHAIEADGVQFLNCGSTSTKSPFAHRDCEMTRPSGKALRFIPYHLRANRGGVGMMRVGLRRLGCI